MPFGSDDVERDSEKQEYGIRKTWQKRPQGVEPVPTVHDLLVPLKRATTSSLAPVVTAC